MELEFKNKELIQLYSTGKSTKYNIPLSVAEKFLHRVLQLESAYSILDIKNTSFLNFQKAPKFKNRFTVEICPEYLLVFDIDWEDDNETKGKFFLIDIINN